MFLTGPSSLQAPTPQQRELMEEAAARIAQDNCELACCFIQKTAVEKAGPEMDKRLATVSPLSVAPVAPMPPQASNQRHRLVLV